MSEDPVETLALGSLHRPGRSRSLPGPIERVLRKGRRANADVLLVMTPKGPLVVKDYARRSAFVRMTLGRLLAAREQAVYREIVRRIGRPAWLPRFEGEIDELAFTLAYRPGRPLSRSMAGELGSAFVDELEAAVRSLHDAGIVHLDLSHRSNVLVDDDGHPIVIDFASALRVRPGGWRHALLVGTLGRIDRRALKKWRSKLEGPAGSGG